MNMEFYTGRGTDSSDERKRDSDVPNHVVYNATENGRVQVKAERESEAAPGPPERSSSWRDLIVQFTQDTTLHGIRYTTQDTRFLIIRRLLWTVMILSALSVFIFYMYERLSMFLLYKMNVSVQENYVPEMAFPAITICNQNPFRLTTAANNGWYQSAKELTKEVGAPIDLRKCVAGEFTCKSGACVPNTKVCDAFPDCSDYSDEEICSLCFRVKVLPSSGSAFTIAMVTDEDFELQEFTYDSKYPVYVRKNRTDPVMLYFDQKQVKWTFGSSFDGGTVYATSPDNATTPQTISAPWSIPGGLTGPLDFRCSNLTIEAPLAGGSGGILRLDGLYESGAEPAVDFIQACSWKGSPCTVADFQKRITDMGVCYTFAREDMNVQSSGPGFGLAMTLNIEQFEYTKDPQNGVGIKVLLHHIDHVPRMQGRAFAISPGLNTMVALEKTSVNNLGAPWGECTTKELKYYSTYTVNTCKMDCENIMAREKCGCRDVDMPQKGPNDNPICTVDQYITCLLPKLQAMRKAVNACECPTPCQETIYLSSLSFASISSDDDTIKRRQREEKFSIMQRRLKAAREISYRVIDDKYRATLRTFQMTGRQVSQMLWLLLWMKEQLADTLTSITSIGREVTTDCLWFSRFQYENSNLLKYKVRQAIQTYQDVFRTQVVMSLVFFRDTILDLESGYSSNEHGYLNTRSGQIQFTEFNTDIKLDNLKMSVDSVNFLTRNNITIDTSATLSAVVDGNTTINLLDNVTLNIEKGTAFYSNLDISATSGNMSGAYARVWLSDEKFWNHTSEVWLRFGILRTSYSYATAMLKDIVLSTQTELLNSFYSLNDTDYRLRNGKAEILLKRSRVSCSWCQTSDDDPLILITRTRLLTYINDTLLVGLNQVQTTLDEIYNDWLVAEVKQNQTAKEDIKTTRLPNLIDATKQLYAGIEANLHATAFKAAYVMDEMLRLLSPKCETELPKKLMEYQDAHLRITSSVAKMITGITLYESKLQKYRSSYVNRKMTLQKLHKEINRLTILSEMETAVASTSSALRDSAQALVRVNEHVSMVYYWFLAQTNDSFLAEKSYYWKQFDMTSADVTLPAGTKMESMVQNEAIKAFWSGLKTGLLSMESNIGYHLAKMKNTLEESNNYLNNFMDGNSLGETFFKKNFLQMDIFYKVLTEKNVSQQKAYEYPALLSEVGGLMGLLLGASCLTLLEFLDLIIYNIFVKCSEHWQSRSNNLRKSANIRPHGSSSRGQHYPRQPSNPQPIQPPYLNSHTPARGIYS